MTNQANVIQTSLDEKKEEPTSVHLLYHMNSTSMKYVEDESVHLVVTSPPYPMIKMWDRMFSQMNPDIYSALESGEGRKAFELMHDELEKVWTEVFRVTIPGGIVCVNVGDALRSIGGHFQLFPNGVEITRRLMKLGFISLPYILWIKPTNRPNKFMGSGTIPPNAYVTLEHEFILIFKKPSLRNSRGNNWRQRRYKSAYFWEERNTWFANPWKIPSEKQSITLPNGSTTRIAAFPLELPLRLINMFSLVGDLILDPFMGTATTNLAALISARNSVGFEISRSLIDFASKRLLETAVNTSMKWVQSRIDRHMESVSKEPEKYKYKSRYGSVRTPHEQEIEILKLTSINKNEHPLGVEIKGKYQRV